MFSFVSILLALSWIASTLAQNVVEDMSFGHKQGISPNSFAIPGWSMQGGDHMPQLLSDKVILTPPYGGNRKASLWNDKKNSLQEWIADFSFRVGATDRGSGVLSLWYADNGKEKVGMSNIYNAGSFDGLSIVIDTTQGVQMIRGFLNDGTKNYQNEKNVDGLAFGHCEYVFRNLGRPSNLQVKSTNAGLDVRIDDQSCFSTDKVKLPADYFFGMTASSADPPDSFEVFKFTLTPTTGTTPQQHQDPNSQQHQQQQQPIQIPIPVTDDKPASDFRTTTAQFEDLHNRLHQLSKSISNLFSQIQTHTQQEESRYNEILNRMPNGQLINNLDTRVANLDRMISNLEKDLKNSDHATQFAKLSNQIQQTHIGVTEHVPQRLHEYVQAHTPRIGFILYSFMAFQTCCILGFGWYKWKKSTLPKKYL